MQDKFSGLTSQQVEESLARNGTNEINIVKKHSFLYKIWHIISEPMFALLLIAAVIYFILGEPRDGAIMFVFVIAIISIEVIQQQKTDRTLNALKDLSAPHIDVIRDGVKVNIASSKLVVGDLMIINEGIKVPADAVIIRCSDLRIDESTLTGEPLHVEKVSVDEAEPSSDYWRKDYCYQGTLVIQGSAYAIVDKIGANTEYGRIGVSVSNNIESVTPLQKQTGKLVLTCAILAGILFVLVGMFSFFNIADHELSDRIIESILSGITVSMAMIPEEFPVILTVFLSMGAWRLAKKNSLVRNLPSVETLGAVSVLCVDKTGTITLNNMTVTQAYAVSSEELLIETMGLACETEAYDPMEKAMLKYCEANGFSKQHLFGGNLLSEYSFSNELKMMGHVWHHDGQNIIACKGSCEGVLELCNLDTKQKKEIDNKILQMSNDGLRVIAVAYCVVSEDNIPQELSECNLTLCGLIGLSDPPRESVKSDIASCIRAGIRVVMITGDNGTTASSIARQIGMKDYTNVITGLEIEQMTDEQLQEKVKTVSIFSRVIPQHKMRIVKAFKDNGEIVAMTGDGVNDAAALKYADIGIAMGKRGSEVCREAADLILLDDNFSTIISTIKDGRRIYDNIRKAVGYVLAIHVPIALAALIAPVLAIAPADLMLLPLHVVLLELIIDPTCSIVLERQPPESNIMTRNPRNSKQKILSSNTLIMSIIQGIMMFAFSFGTYLYIYYSTSNAVLARTMSLTIIVFANLFLVISCSSDYDYAFTVLKKLLKDKVMWIANIIVLILLAVAVYSPLNDFLKLTSLSIVQVLIAVGFAFASVIWRELVKVVKLIKVSKKKLVD